MWKWTSIRHTLIQKNRFVNHVFSGNVILLPNVYEVFTKKNAKINKYLAKRRFWPFALDD